LITKVASIHFAPLHAERHFGGLYDLPAVPLGSDPAILTIPDRRQVEQGPISFGQNGRRSVRVFVVNGEDIARDVVAQWTENGIFMTPQCRPGVWLVRDTVPLVKEDGTVEKDADGKPMFRMATGEEQRFMFAEDLMAARAADREYAYRVYQKAEADTQDKRLIPYVSPVAKLGARQYGMDAEWVADSVQAANIKNCQYCTKIIPGRAIKCPHCQEVVDVDAYARLEAEKKIAMRLATDEANRRAKETAA
jgi:hypothetical protein